LVDTSPVDEKQTKFEPLEHMKEVQEPILEQIHIDKSLGNTLIWGEKQIPNLVDEVTDIQAISYDRNRKDIMKRTTKKIRLMLDRSILITTKEKLLSTEHAKKYDLIDTQIAITDATLNREQRYEKELATVLKDLEHLHHLEKYYQDSMQATVFLRGEFQDAYVKFTNEQHLFTAGIGYLQEDTLMELTTYKYVERWHEKSYQVVERIDYINVVQKGRDIEEHGIQVLRERNIAWIRKSDEYWVKMA
jgi:hypothetical protein